MLSERKKAQKLYDELAKEVKLLRQTGQPDDYAIRKLKQKMEELKSKTPFHIWYILHAGTKRKKGNYSFGAMRELDKSELETRAVAGISFLRKLPVGRYAVIKYSQPRGEKLKATHQLLLWDISLKQTEKGDFKVVKEYEPVVCEGKKDWLEVTKYSFKNIRF